MSWLDQDDSSNYNSVGFIIGYALLAVAFCISMVQAVYDCRRPIYNKHTVRILFPWASFCLMLENATLAADNILSRSVWKDVIYALQATVAPTLLLSIFDVTYIIHKTRHVRFMGIIHDGQYTRPRRYLNAPRIIIWSIRMLALLLFVLRLLVNFNVGFTSPLLGKVGWWHVVTARPFDYQVLISLLPMGICCLGCFYFSLVLWRYGTESSFLVHSSPLNPWFSPFFGTMGMTVGQWFGSTYFLLLSNVGIFVFCVSLLFLVVQVNKDLESAVQLNTFLHAFDELRSSEVRHYQEYQQKQQDTEEEQASVVVDEKWEAAVQQGDDVRVDKDKVDDKKNGAVEMEHDRVKLKKIKVVEFAEETTEIVDNIPGHGSE